MAYYLGIDIGTTYTAAAVWRDGRNEIASLGNRAPTIPSVVLLRDDGAVLTGEAAVRRAATEPGRVAREFKRRVGDPTPIIVGGTPYSADALMAKLLRWVVDHVASVEGGPPSGIAVSHPANWGNYKLDLLRQAVSMADLDGVVTLTEPEAAAITYASQARVEPGSVIAVYDLGGGTFDAAVLRKSDTGWDILGAPEGIERLGGVDFDEAVFHHVVRAIGGAVDELDPDDPTAQAAVARLRQECIDAKEALSSDSDVSIPVMLPNLQTEVRLTRGEYEQMVRPALGDSITTMNRALRSAQVAPADVTAVLLVGGSSRTPLVAELVSTALGRPVAVDAHPKYGVAMGAAITAATDAGATDSPPASPGTTSSSSPGAATRSGGPLAAAAAGAAAGAAASHLAGRSSGAGGSTPATTTGQATPSAVPPTGPAPTVDPAATIAAPPTSPSDATEAFGAPPGRDPRSVTVPYAEGPRTDRSTGRVAGTRAIAPDHGRERMPSGAQGRGRDPLDGDNGARRGDGGAPTASSSRRPLLVALGAIVAVALLGAVAVRALGGGDDDDPTLAADSAGADSDAAPTDEPAGGEDQPRETTTPETPTTEAAPAGPSVQIDEVVLDGGQYRVNYQVIGYEPSMSEGALHVHFFPETQPAAEAGSNGPAGSDWDVTAESSSFLTKYTPDNTPGASQMCSAVADHVHAVHTPEVTTGNCVALPSA